MTTERTLAPAEHPMSWTRLQQVLYAAYKDARIAEPNERFHLWATDTSLLADQNPTEHLPADFFVTQPMHKLGGEVGYEWMEMAEVASHFMGSFDTFVCDRNGNLLRPSWASMHELVRFMVALPDTLLTYEEELALELMFGGFMNNLPTAR